MWNWEALRDHREVIACEAVIDALTFWVAGYRNVTSSYGIEGFTPLHWELVRRYGIGRILLAYDADAAGDRAAEAVAERLMAEGIECFRVEFPRGTDANAYALRATPASSSLGDLIRRAAWMGRGVRPGAAGPVVSGSRDEVAAARSPAVDDESAVVAREMPLALAARLLAAEPVASPVPEAPADEIPCEVRGEDVHITLGDRHYRVRGLDRNLSYGALKVNVSAMRGQELHADTLDLELARARKDFAREAAVELGVDEQTLKRDLGRVLRKLEELQEARIRATLEPKRAEVALSDEQREAALELLGDRRLLDRLLEDFERYGVVGERTNKLVGYLTAVSRKLAEPLVVIIQSSSAAGKTSLMEAVLAFVPEEERVKYSAMTGQSLFYMSEVELRHKVLALVEEEGVASAAYALKLLQSEGELRIASTGKDPQTGRLVTHEYRVEGPVALLVTTTAVEIDEELQNRCIVLTVDEDREQTRLIHQAQRERRTLEGLLRRRGRDRVLELHRNAQRLLRSVAVLNPWARRLTFLDDKTRTRRDHEKYLTLIDVIAFVHQYQREVRTMCDEGGSFAYIEVELSDIELANRLAGEVLGRSLDELAPKTRRRLDVLDAMVEEACERRGLRREEYRFTQRDVRERAGWSATQIKVHLQRLVELEYVLVHRGGRGQQFVYELVYDGGGKDGSRFLIGLIEVDELRAHEYDPNRSGHNGAWSEENGGWSGGGPPVVRPWSVGGPSVETDETPRQDGADAGPTQQDPEDAYMGDEALSYLYAGRSRSAAPGGED